ncbi:MAG: radical SAM protein [Desulfobacteraceae bacterium]|nr:radical SAM protein [Desulfobacteraceae bacterium]
MINRIINAGLRPPASATIMITNRCNLQCAHCLPESSPDSVFGPVPVNTLKQVIRNLVQQLGIKEICITGGEPFTHPSWFELLSYCSGLSGVQSLRVQTNAALLNTRTINLLKSIDSGLILEVSLEGASPATNDKVRGSGNFYKTMQGFKLLSEYGLGPKTRIAFTEMRHNFGDFPELLKIAEQLELSGVTGSTLVKKGRAVSQGKTEPPLPEQYVEILNLFHTDKLFRSRYQKLGRIAPLEWLANRDANEPETCKCIRDLYITADGRMYPCVMMTAERFAVKDIFGRSLADVLPKALAIWTELPELFRRRSIELQQCRGCPGYMHCAGGCMGRAYSASGGFMFAEDRCELRKTVYSWNSPEK